MAIDAAAIDGYSQQVPSEKILTLSVGVHLIRQDLLFSSFVRRDVSPIHVGLGYASVGRVYHNISLRYSGFTPMVDQPYQYTDRGEK